jgi:hypothetical protein
MAKEKLTNKLETISTSQLEYTAEKLFSYGTISVAVLAVYAAVVYMGVQQLKK